MKRKRRKKVKRQKKKQKKENEPNKRKKRSRKTEEEKGETETQREKEGGRRKSGQSPPTAAEYATQYSMTRRAAKTCKTSPSQKEIRGRTNRPRR